MAPRLALAFALVAAACSPASSGTDEPSPTGGKTVTGGSRAGGNSAGGGGGQSNSGASTGGTSAGGSGGVATGGAPAEGGASGAGGTGGAEPSRDANPGSGGTPADAAPETGGAVTDAPPAAPRPDAEGAACASGGNYNFTIRPFTSQKGTFTAWFTANPGKSPSNSVIGLSDGMKYLHDDFSAIIRFADNGNLDARNDTGYMSLTPIKYKETDYKFRLVVDVPGRKYSAFVSFDGMPEVPLGIDFKFRDTAATPTKLDHWGVEAIAGHSTKVCGFLAQ